MLEFRLRVPEDDHFFDLFTEVRAMMFYLRLAVLLALLFATETLLAAEPDGPLGVPQIDLSSEKALQVVVDREAGQYLGHPTTVLLEDGRTMIIVYPKGHGRGGIVMKRSTDGGLTWNERLPTPASWATSLEVPTIYRTVDKSGKKRLIMFSGLYPIRQAASEDDGATWSELVPIGNFGGVVACASLVSLRNGDYMALFHDDGRFITATKPPKGTPPKFVVYKITSSDGGLTWGKPEPIAEHATAHLCEPGAVRSPDGKQIAVLLRENSRKMNSFIIFSDDEGKTWTKPREVPNALTGDRHTAKYLVDGKLFITFRDNLKTSPTFGDWVAWIGTYDDLVKNTNGSFRLRLMDNTKGADCAYPSVELLPDGTLVTTTYGHWTEGEMPYIVSVRLPLQRLGQLEIDAFKKVIADQKEKISAEIEKHRRPLAGNASVKPRHNEPEARAYRLVIDTVTGVDSYQLAGRPGEPGQTEWRELAKLNDPHGFAGQFVGVSRDRLLMYGGSNFPGKKVWEGGVKSWYADVFVLPDRDAHWRKVGPLAGERPVGYGVSLSTDDGMLIVGGADAKRHFSDVFYLNLDPQAGEGKELSTRDLPPLPKPCAYSCGARIGDTVYVAGGIETPDAIRTMRNFWSLDLKNLAAGWKELPTWPGPPRMLALAAVHDGVFYLMSGVDLSPDAFGKPMRRYHRDAYRYSCTTGWEKLADLPRAFVAAPSPAMVEGDRIIAFGGDDGRYLGFKPPEKHPGFPHDHFAYDVKYDRWHSLGNQPYPIAVTPLVEWKGGYVAASGEVRPAVRSTATWWVKATK